MTRRQARRSTPRPSAVLRDTDCPAVDTSPPWVEGVAVLLVLAFVLAAFGMVLFWALFR